MNYNHLPLKRISKELQQHFHKIDNPENIIFKENFDDNTCMEVKLESLVNISSYCEYYVYAKNARGEHSKNEKSLPCLSNLQKSTYKHKRADICVLEHNTNNDEINIYIAEMKKKLNLEKFVVARQQLLSSYIDLKIISTILLHGLALNNIQTYIIGESIVKSTFLKKASLTSMTVKKSRDKGRSVDHQNIALKEYESSKLVVDMDINDNDDRDRYRDINFSLSEISGRFVKLNIVDQSS